MVREHDLRVGGSPGTPSNGLTAGDEPARRFGAHLDLGAHEVTPVTPPWVALGEIQETSSTIRVVGLTGRRCTLQASDDLVGWLDLGTGTAASGIFELTVGLAEFPGARFFRAVLAS